MYLAPQLGKTHPLSGHQDNSDGQATNLFPTELLSHINPTSHLSIPGYAVYLIFVRENRSSEQNHCRGHKLDSPEGERFSPLHFEEE